MQCNKDYTTTWVGTYSGVNTTVIIAKIDDNTVQIKLQRVAGPRLYTYTIIQRATIIGSAAVINEDEIINGSMDIYHLFGSAALSGSSITVTGSATNKTNPSDVQQFSFSGSK